MGLIVVLYIHPVIHHWLGFPSVARRELAKTPNVVQVRACVAATPKVAAYLCSPCRIAFNKEGILRRCPELDVAS